MLFDPLKQKKIAGIPKRLQQEWFFYTSEITPDEQQAIIEWINDKFDQVMNRQNRVQPSGWLASGFNWSDSPLLPIFRECQNRMNGYSDEEIEEKAGQIFGLFVAITLADHRNEIWYFVKGEEYQAHGIPIKSRIYFLPDD